MVAASFLLRSLLPHDASLAHDAGFAMADDRAWLRITGQDATRWLNGMVTNSIQALEPGAGCYNFFLNAQGRIQGDGTIYREADSETPTFLLATDSSQAGVLQAYLDRYIIMDDVELSPAFEEQSSLQLLGSGLAELLPALGLPALDPLRLAHVSTPAGQVLASTPAAGPVPQIYLQSSPATVQEIATRLGERGVPLLDASAREQIRVFAAEPRFGRDIRDKDLAQETNQMQALHFSKGCYLGQEIVERIRSRGQVHRLLTPFRLEGAIPSHLPVPLEADGKAAGELTSIVSSRSPEGEVLLALGYVRREFLASGVTLTYAGGVARSRAAGQFR